MEFLTDKEYQHIAKKILFSNYNKSLAERVYLDPIDFGEVVSSIMQADWKWNGKGTIFGYRKQRVKWTMFKVIKGIANRNPLGDKVFCIGDFEESSFLSPTFDRFVKDLEFEDQVENIRKKINNSSSITDREREVMIDVIVEGNKPVDVASRLNIHRQSVYQGLKRGIQKMGGNLV